MAEPPRHGAHQASEDPASRPRASVDPTDGGEPGRDEHGSVRPRRRQMGRSILARERASVGYAVQGITHAWRTQPNLRIQVGLAGLAVALGLALGLPPGDWAALLTMTTLILVLELLNTVVEATVDLVSPRFHPLAKTAKDVAAGAVLVAALGAIAVGAVLFVPRLWALAGR